MKRERRNYWTEAVAVQDRPRKSWREIAGEAYLRAASERLTGLQETVQGAEAGVHSVCGSLTDARDAQ